MYNIKNNMQEICKTLFLLLHKLQIEGPIGRVHWMDVVVQFFAVIFHAIVLEDLQKITSY